ncbi:hypothetical protein VSQ32_19155 [Lachnospiraceae bacterium KK002]
MEFSEWEIIIRLLSELLVFNLDDSGRFRRETDMSISGNIRTYIFGMGKQDETEADMRCSVQDLTEDLQIQKSGQKGLRKRRNQEEFQEKP